MDSQNSATLVIREVDASKPKSDDSAKGISDPAASNADTNGKKSVKRSGAPNKTHSNKGPRSAAPPKKKQPTKTEVIESSASEGDSDLSSLQSGASTDSDSSSSESSSADEGTKKGRRSKKRRNAAKAHKRHRSRKSTKPTRVQEPLDSGSDSESEDSSSDSRRSSASLSDTDSEAGEDGPRGSRRAAQLQQQDLARLMLLQKHQPPPPAFNPYQQFAQPVYYGSPMGVPVGAPGYGGGFAHFGSVPQYIPPPQPPVHLPQGMHGRHPPPMHRDGNKLGGRLPGDLNDGTRKSGKIASKRRKSSKHKRTPKSMDFKRVDLVWDSATHNFRLQDTAEELVDAEYEGYLFHVRRTFDWDGKYKQTVVDVKSKLLREALQEVMGDIKGVGLVEETPKLDPNMLFLYLEDMRQHIKTLKSTKPTGDSKTRKKEAKHIEKKRQQLKVLVKYLDKDYEAVKTSLAALLDNGLITFDLLWALWKPNTLAFTTMYRSEDQPRVFKAETSEKHCSPVKGYFYYIEGKYFEYDGKRFGFGSVADEIGEFRGAREITSLPVYPLRYHKREQQLRQELIDRGKKFVALSGVQYRSYDGMAYYKQKRTAVKVNISGRIMVDSGIHRRINPNYPISIVRSQDHDAMSDDEGMDDEWDCNDSDGGNQRTRVLQEQMEPASPDKGSQKSDDLTPDSTEENTEAEDAESEKKLREFGDEEYLIASPVVLGFAFAEKMWLEFTVSNVKGIQWNENAYESLVLEPKTKDIVKALVESHKYHAAESIDDVIQGKGKGLVAVLHGPPGTGKTLTAEGISELLKCPLYMVSAGELGTDSRFLESELQKILSICHAWGAILLLDEADVFLEKRNMHDIHRNALVSIFLRQLEYFQGILFLTTNRVETFDDAFQSRIHLALRYDSLDHRAKKAIFKIFIERVRVLEKIDLMPFTEEDFNALARHELNGRQIKNTVRTAQALAVNKGEPLSMSHIRQVLDVHMSFDRDLKGGPGFQDAMRSYF